MSLERLKKPSELAADEIAAFGALGQEYLHFFTVFILGHDLLTPPEGFHGEVCARLSDIGRPQLNIYYRKAYKSTIGGRARPLWRAVQDPESFDHITLVSDIALGKQQLRAIGLQIEENELLRTLYPEIRPNPKVWSDTSRSLAVRDIRREGPTFELRTMKQPKAGRHVAAITLDDLVNDANYTSRFLQDELKERFDLLWPTLDTDDLLILATPYTDYDLTAHLIRQLYPEELDVYLQPVRGQAWIEEGQIKSEDDGVYADPLQWDDERFEQERRRMKAMFWPQYMLNTRRQGALGFRASWIQRLTQAELPRNDEGNLALSVYIALDSASGKGTSRPAVAVCGIDAEGRYIALASRSDFKSEAAAIDAFFAAHTKWHPVMMGVECWAHGGYGTMELIQNEARKRKQYLPLERLTGANQHERIKGILRPVYEWGDMYHVQGLTGSEYENQLLSYPGGQFIDEIDAMSRALALAKKFGFHKPAEKPQRRPFNRQDRSIGYTLEQMIANPPFPEDKERATSW